MRKIGNDIAGDNSAPVQSLLLNRDRADRAR